MRKKFDYNTTREPLKLPEYGRNIQRMVDFMKSIEDREERNLAARTIVAIMANMYPQNREMENFEHKLWDHLAIMADFDLDIDAPFELPTEEKLQEKPRKVPYSTHNIKYKHYGFLVEQLLREVAEMDDDEAKEYAIVAIANHMKKQYLTWNRPQVNDQVIFKDIEEITGGAVKVKEGTVLKDVKELLPQQPQQQKNYRKKKNQRKNK
jgi:predicted MPP superfamily phosphohydrolase